MSQSIQKTCTTCGRQFRTMLPGNTLCNGCFMKAPPSVYRQDGSDPWTGEELALVQAGRHIDAVKAYRDRTRCSLFDAKRSHDLARMGVDPSASMRCPHCDGRGLVPRR
jgi:DNA-directed RNA polymerase subunit RPC12/RpoP